MNTAQHDAPPRPPAGDQRGAVRDYLHSMPLWAALLLLVCIWIAFAVVTNAQRERELASGKENLRQLTFAIAQHTAQTFKQEDQLVRVLRETYSKHGLTIPLAEWTKIGVIDSRMTVLASIIDAQGMMAASNLPMPAKPLDLSDREHFTVHKNGTGDELFVSKTIIGRQSGKPAIQITRRIDDHNGNFAGVAVVSTDPNYLIAAYRPLLPETGVITLTGLDGFVRIRLSHKDAQYSRDVNGLDWFKNEFLARESGFMLLRSSVDGLERVYAYQRVPGVPLVVSVSIGEDELLGNFNRARSSYFLFTLALSALILAISVVMHRMLSNLRRSAARLAAQEHAAARAYREKAEFLATVSHELAGPLHGIRGSAELIQLDSSSVELRERAHQIFNSANHLLAIVTQVREHAEPGARGHQLKPRLLALRPLLEQAVGAQQMAAGRKNIGLALEILPQAPEKVVCDATALLRVLHNLLDNAVKFTTAGSVVVRALPAAEGLRIEVQDSGPGIPAAARATLFAPPTASQGAPGSGLGLALSKELVEQMGGTLEVESRPAAGATFVITLPPPRNFGRAPGAR